MVVEDELQIRELISRYLENAGYNVLTATNGNDALEKARTGAIDLMVLDIMIPRPDGLDVTRIVRSASALPILIVSARGEEADRVAGLELGADDYLTKPFASREMLARVKSLLRRAKMPSVESPSEAGIVIDFKARTVKVEGDRVELTGQEFELLRLLASVPDKSFTRDEILDAVWGEEYVGESRRVDNCISRLRNKLRRSGKPDPIRSIWGVGYRFEP